mmetsp:Transcript_29417/g.73867  ORF Transcript_29417/g.73867 Transcript_29417/m.73867 type:complete len:253 (-) Transcript_29417:2302-3060(-)|eukprot:CAMPEP_0174890500 /NCGR_PEP_ID=MMETSP0167-20121228/5646_1 /TAXON_ID=38298 /ORGANISM="Rhodella maculata, Strain CCMP736" /LENGTH=252 /DNA_ID=CAMNT_0016128313 /DNA_START=122 /DNA_END=880 /DNA_ORIENTATION=-
MPSGSAKIALLYGTIGGLGDVGKFAVIHAFTQLEPSDIRVVALSAEATEGSGLGLEIDVKVDAAAEHESFKHAIENLDVKKVDVESDGAEGEIAAAINGVDAVVACIGNRQPSMARWLAVGARKIVAAMKSKSIERLVILSSMGIGEDFVSRLNPISLLWSGMLWTVLRSARKDLYDLEASVEGSGLDYLIVRPMGIDPGCAKQGKWKLLQSAEDGKLEFTISKSDVALFLVEQALEPTLQKTAVTIGSEPK